MCNCIQELQKPERYTGKKGEKVHEPTVEDWAFIAVGSTVKMVTATTLSYRLEGKKKRQEMMLPHNFCPFCGQKNRENEPQNIEP